ncbi:SDR family oxidoreductase [Pseudoduganella umbonata]|uniref:NAD(P)-dependent dehydrogenase (Short-subunit alcohol dehydrogenase family) n=1 Tax=Pseudoduganella umbonata TaxID=864828 RepID=A0A4P8HTA6_9BURK|nr:SDR family oxidoreductase [Pseudoduganella umbonata]MBB3220535.1 NAD(P)-dependent dehydrogenase (short-subunit alcohol dehydrogenase family) [Pseudoduganella umbonata]QCP11952.1 SDR family oxidoreductase [Pseudoduganella umbonata]
MNTPVAAQTSFSNLQAGSLTGKVVVVFGGTSGIGLAAAVQAKAAGAKVIVIGNDRTRAQQAAQAHGFEWRTADVTQSDAVHEALKEIPKVDHLVLLAGTFVAAKVLDGDVDYMRRAFEERVWASVHAIRALNGRMSSDGSITFISGVLADRPNAQGTAVLAAASAAMEALARGLALELAPIRVNTLSPGHVETPLLHKVLGDARDTVLPAMRASTPLKRLGTAEEAGAATVFLMANGWMNGTTLHIDGGVSLI